MTAPSPASSAQPGWRGTDPDGGTWVLTPRKDSLPWIEVLVSNGRAHYRSQEEAEAAGLVPLVAADGRAAEGSFVRCDKEGPNGQCDQNARVTHVCSRKGHPIDSVETGAGERFTPGIDTAPAPLDPGNPEHLRQVADVLGRLTPRSLGVTMTLLDGVLRGVRALADRIEREAAEKVQEAEDRKLATEKARAKNPAEWETLPESDQNTIVDMVLTGIRAADERAGRAEGSAS
ncbi:hypothetical protein FK268_09275 [Tsukamurella sputi]|uniref:Uncharacterized protein n=1 Tax=Tsukamurella sputi TaxID=2591848 RepID=A0A5C5RT03_9ACTN|nr:hypothetical protein [Tsukamurella sputi]TWS25371.1 hypothetical protein FK268_09275 [Tsukamurella sputi]